jgi:hypothetical protein
MTLPHDTPADEGLARLLSALAPRLLTAKAELVAEIEARMSVLLGVEVREAFRAVAAQQQHAAPSMNLDRAHKVGAGARRSRVDRGDARSRERFDRQHINDLPDHDRHV